MPKDQCVQSAAQRLKDQCVRFSDLQQELSRTLTGVLSEDIRLKQADCYHPLPGTVSQRRKSYCHSLSCPACNRWESKRESRRLLSALHSVQPSQLLVGTFTLEDVRPEATAEAVTVLDDSFKRLCGHRALRFAEGSHRSIEIDPSGVTPALSNAHIHAIFPVSGGYSGRNRPSQGDWEDIWQETVSKTA